MDNLENKELFDSESGEHEVFAKAGDKLLSIDDYAQMDAEKQAQTGEAIKTAQNAQVAAFKTPQVVRQATIETPQIYNANANNRLAYTVTDSTGEKFPTAHVFGSLDDARYLQWINEFNASFDPNSQDEVTEQSREASIRLWNDLIVEVENIDIEPGQDWKASIPESEKINAITDFLAVAISESGGTGQGKRKLGETGTRTVYTEAFFNDINKPVRQKHVLRNTPGELTEFEKKYNRIQSKRFKEEITTGLRRKPKLEFVPQDKAIGELYDQMFVSSEGFEDGFIPLRFKTVALGYIFAPTLDPKK